MTDRHYRTALVTGASSGIGWALSRWLATRGTRVYAAARRSELLDELARGTDGDIVAVPMDVADAQASRQRIDALWDEAGGLDLVVANAGVSFMTDARRPRWEQIAQIIAVNVTGAAATLMAALPHMLEQNAGHLVGISSVAAVRGLPKHGAYCASKAFLSTFLESLRVDLHSTAIDVTCIQPGFVRTALTEKNTFKMPFIVGPEVAAEHIGRAIERRDAVYTFPWPFSAVAQLAGLVPDGIFERAAARAAPKSSS